MHLNLYILQKFVWNWKAHERNIHILLLKCETSLLLRSTFYGEQPDDENPANPLNMERPGNVVTTVYFGYNVL